MHINYPFLLPNHECLLPDKIILSKQHKLKNVKFFGKICGLIKYRERKYFIWSAILRICGLMKYRPKVQIFGVLRKAQNANILYRPQILRICALMKYRDRKLQNRKFSAFTANRKTQKKSVNRKLRICGLRFNLRSCPALKFSSHARIYFGIL